MYSSESVLVKCATVYVRVGQEFSHLVAVGIVVQHLEALFAEEAGVAWSQLVVGGQPPSWGERNKKQ